MNDAHIREYDNPDPLGIIPDIELSFQNTSYGIGIVGSLAMIGYGILVHFSTLNSSRYPIIATVTNADCVRFPINNHQSEYHCVIEIEYPGYPGSPNMITNSLTFVDHESFFEGDQVNILVDRHNPMVIDMGGIPDNALSIIYCLCGMLLLIVVTGIRFMRIV
jgi:hypothetical protein